jgi:hypothetical protein
MTIHDLRHLLLVFIGLLTGLAVGFRGGVLSTLGCGLAGFLIAHLVGILLMIFRELIEGLIYLVSRKRRAPVLPNTHTVAPKCPPADSDADV